MMARKIEAQEQYQQILGDLKKGNFQPVYLLTGEEPYFIDALVEYIAQNALEEPQKEFDQNILYGRDVDVSELASLAKQFPMMGERQLLVVKEAQDIKKIDELLPYLENPVQSTILVIACKKKFDKRSKVWKAVDKHGVTFRSEKVRDYLIPQWITGHVKEKGLDLDPKAANLLADHLGNDLNRIANELEKLTLVVKAGTKIGPDEIERNIGISKDFNIFELQEALGKKDVYRVNKIIDHFASNPKEHPLVKELFGLYNYFSKLLKFHALPGNDKRDEKKVASELKVHPFFVKGYARAAKYYTPGKLVKIISILREYDKKGKGMGNASASDGQLMKEMVYRIMH